MKRKIVSILLALCMTLSLLPMTALAAEKDTVITENGEVVTGVHNERVVIQAEDVSVKGAKLNGGLLIDEAAGGTVTLSTDTVVATVVISAEGVSLVVEAKAEVKAIEVNAKAAAVTVEGKVDTVTVAETAEAAAVTVAATATVKAVEVNAPASTVEVQGKVETVTVGETAVGAAATVAETATVKAVENNAPKSTVEVQGKVESMTVGETATGAATTVAATASVGKMDVKAEDTKLDVADGGSVGTVTSDKEIDVTGDGAGKVEVTPPAEDTGSSTTPDKEPTLPPVDQQPVTKTITIYAMVGEGENAVKTAVGARIVDANTNAVISDTIDSKYADTYKLVVDTSSKEDVMAYCTLESAIKTGVGKNDTATVTVLSNIEVKDYVTVYYGKNVTLDLGNNTVTAAANKIWVACETSESEGYETRPATGMPSLTIIGGEHGKMTGSGDGNVIIVEDGGKVVLESGTIQTDNGSGLFVGNGSVFEMNGGTITAGAYAVSTNGSAKGNANWCGGAAITVNDGKLSSDYVAIYAPANGSVTVNGGTLSGPWGALQARDGTITLNGGAFVNTCKTGNTTPESKDWDTSKDGCEPVANNPAVSIIPNYVRIHRNEGKMTVTIGSNVKFDQGGFVITQTTKPNAATLTLSDLVALTGINDSSVWVSSITSTSLNLSSVSTFDFMPPVELSEGEYLLVETEEAAETINAVAEELGFNADDVKLYWTKTGDGAAYIVLIGVTSDETGDWSMPGESVLVTVEIPEDYTGEENLSATITVTAKAPVVEDTTPAESEITATESPAEELTDIASGTIGITVVVPSEEVPAEEIPAEEAPAE